jgi:hypothetical protein
MKPDSEILTAQQSLDIITQMIRAAKGNVQQNSFYFLLWGWVIVLANLGMFILGTISYEHPHIVWAITIPAWIISIVRSFREGKSEGKSATHFGKISGSLWLSFGVVIFTLVAFGFKINYQLNPVILLISSIPTFATGVIIRFRPLMIGGIVFWIGGIISFLLPMEMQPLLGAIAITCGYLIPGYLLKTMKG